MRQPGRKSAASLAVIPGVERARPEPPRTMERAAKLVWRETVAQFRSEHFYGAEPVLEAYVRAVVLGRDLAKRVEEAKAGPEPLDYKKLAVLMQLLKAQGLLIARLASTLRLSPKARLDRYSAAARPLSGLPKPWDLGNTGRQRGDCGPGEGGSPFDAA
jgi:hypothetical protein